MSEQHYRVTLDSDAEKQFSKLDKPMQRRITIALVKLEADPRPSGVKKLKGRKGLPCGLFCLVRAVGPPGLEPGTCGLKVRSSAN